MSVIIQDSAASPSVQGLCLLAAGSYLCGLASETHIMLSRAYPVFDTWCLVLTNQSKSTGSYYGLMFSGLLQWCRSWPHAVLQRIIGQACWENVLWIWCYLWGSSQQCTCSDVGSWVMPSSQPAEVMCPLVSMQYEHVPVGIRYLLFVHLFIGFFLV